jgi:hypothetical protein
LLLASLARLGLGFKTLPTSFATSITPPLAARQALEMVCRPP